MLTQDQINQIVARNGGMWTDPETGQTYMANYAWSGSQAEGAADQNRSADFLTRAVNPGQFTQGSMIENYDLAGKGGGEFMNPKSTLWQDALAFAGPPLMAAGLGYMASGGKLPFDLPGGGSDAAPLGAGGGYDVPATFNAAMDSQLANSTLGLPANAAFSGGVSGLPAASGGGWMSKIADAVGGADNLKLLGSLGTGLLAAGSPAPQSTRESKMDPRLDPYVYGDKGVIPMASLLYQNRTNPTSQTMTDRAALRAKAKGLLGI